MVVEDVARIQADVDDMFKETVQRALTPLKVVEVKEKPTQDVGHIDISAKKHSNCMFLGREQDLPYAVRGVLDVVQCDARRRDSKLAGPSP